MQKEQIAQKILKDCFWDSDINIHEILDIFNNNDDFRKKAFLFNKILLNSTKLFAHLSMFEKNDLERLIKEYKVSRFNAEYAKRRLNLAEVFFLDMPLKIEELRWV